MSARTLRLVLPGIPPALNEYRRMHHMAQYQSKQEWQEKACVAAWCSVGTPVSRSWGPPAERARITVTFVYPDRRRRDPDNAAAGLKGILDGLVEAGIVKDDDFDHVELVVRRGEPDKASPRVEVLVEEVG
jgi:crossover junction endodeoxyribonuclease RusA